MCGTRHLLAFALLSGLSSAIQTNFAIHSVPQTDHIPAHNQTSTAGDLWPTSETRLTHSVPQTGANAGQGSRIREQWLDLQSLSAQLAVRTVFENIHPTIDQLFQQNNVSIACQSSVYKVLADAALLKKYAVQRESFLDDHSLIDGRL